MRSGSTSTVLDGLYAGEQVVEVEAFEDPVPVALLGGPPENRRHEGAELRCQLLRLLDEFKDGGPVFPDRESTWLRPRSLT